MALAANGQWYPVIPDAPPGEGTGNGRGLLTGTGAPDDANGANGNIYVDISTGDIYTKSGDTWTIVSGGSGAVQVISGAFDDPNGNVTPADPTKGAIYYKNGAFSLWNWTTPAGPWVAINS